eukprot:1415801-Prymnesium_polylepis.1
MSDGSRQLNLPAPAQRRRARPRLSPRACARARRRGSCARRVRGRLWVVCVCGRVSGRMHVVWERRGSCVRSGGEPMPTRCGARPARTSAATRGGEHRLTFLGAAQATDALACALRHRAELEEAQQQLDVRVRVVLARCARSGAGGGGHTTWAIRRGRGRPRGHRARRSEVVCAQPRCQGDPGAKKEREQRRARAAAPSLM